VLINLPREDFKRAFSWFRSRVEEAVEGLFIPLNVKFI
jgi:hypothetical protein